MPDLTEAATDLLFEADNYSIGGLDITADNEDAAQELIDAGFAVKEIVPCGEPNCCETDVIRLTADGVAEMGRIAAES